MCGIAGEFAPAGSGWTAAALERLGHRGPDASTRTRAGPATLGCTRLAIRGGAAGDQPRRTRRGTLVFNGEIYNAAELAKDLAWHGETLDPESDTALVGGLLDVYGIRAVDRLNGMFALAWQEDGGPLWLARDPAGIKPLHYRGTRFCSEIRPLLDGDAALEPAALARWLTFHVAWGEQTLFRDVRRVPPGGIVRLPEGEVVRAGPAALRFGSPNPGLDAGRLRRILARAVRDAVPDEPFGVALSGGLDSTLVAALAREHGPAVAFHGRVAHEGCDESAWARAAARDLDLALVEVPVTAEACLAALPRVVDALEEPVAGPGSVAQWLVAERAATRVRILFSGCGGDELFGGYARLAALRTQTPPPGLEAYAPLFSRVAGTSGTDRLFALLDRRDPALFRPDFLEAHPAPREEFRERFAPGGLDPFAAAARAEIGIVLPGLLQVEDRVSMAFSVEARVPLLDRRLLRCAARLAPEQRLDSSGRLKALLRDAAAPLLPAAVRDRRDKMGFPLPVGEWLAGPWNAFARDVAYDRRTRERGMLDAAGVERALQRPGRYDRGLVSALALELWCRSFLDD